MPHSVPRPLLILPVVLLVLALLGTGFFLRDTPPAPSVSAAQGGTLPEDAEITVALRTVVPVWVEAVGAVRPRSEIAVSAQVQAEVRRVRVRAGQQVRRREPLLDLDDRELQARLAQGRHELDAMGSALKRTRRIQERTRAEFELAQAEFERIQALHNQEAAATRELDQARAEFLAAKAESGRAEQGIQELIAQQARLEQRIKELTVGLSHTSIAASENGVIARRFVEPGDVVQPGATLFLLHSPDVRLEFQVPERFHAMMTVGAEFTARVDALGQEFPAVVDEIEPLAAEDSRTFTVKLVPAPAPSTTAAEISWATDLRPGMFVRLHIPVSAEPVVLVDSRAVLRVGQLALAAVIRDDSTYTLRHLRLGRAHDDQVEVLSGLKGGERLWLQPLPGP